MIGDIWVSKENTTCSDGLVGYDTTFTRLGPRVRLPLRVLFLFGGKVLMIKILILYHKGSEIGIKFLYKNGDSLITKT